MKFALKVSKFCKFECIEAYLLSNVCCFIYFMIVILAQQKTELEVI